MELRPETAAIYTVQALERMSQALDRFDDRTVNQRPHGSSTNSAAALITHACASSTFWFGHVGLDRPVVRDRDAEFVAESTVEALRVLLGHTAVRVTSLGAELDARPEEGDNELRLFLPGDDPSDSAIVLHVLEELYQHLGHLELTADALAGAD